jgi:hypothetical protein
MREVTGAKKMVDALAAKRMKTLGYARVLVALFAHTAQQCLSHFVVL